MRTFVQALEARDLQAIRRCPKADLHIHGIGGGDRAFLRERTGVDAIPVGCPLRSMAEMHAFADRAFGQIFSGAVGRALAFEATFVQARKDGLTRIELGEDAWSLTLHPGGAAAVWAMLCNAHQSAAPGIEWIAQLGISRDCSAEAVERWVTLRKEQAQDGRGIKLAAQRLAEILFCVAASSRALCALLQLGVFKTLDLYGDESAQAIEVFAPVYRRAKKAGLRLKAHVGEWGTADDVWRAVEVLELDEVQHGIAASKSPDVMNFLAANGIRLNICPTSNVKLGRVADLAAHPIRQLFDAGVRVTVNTDDPLMFGTTLSEEFLALYDAGLMTAAELDAIRIEALTARD